MRAKWGSTYSRGVLNVYANFSLFSRAQVNDICRSVHPYQDQRPFCMGLFVMAQEMLRSQQYSHYASYQSVPFRVFGFCPALSKADTCFMLTKLWLSWRVAVIAREIALPSLETTNPQSKWEIWMILELCLFRWLQMNYSNNGVMYTSFISRADVYFQYEVTQTN